MKSPSLLLPSLAAIVAIGALAATSHAMTGRPSSSTQNLANGDRHACFDPDNVRNFQTLNDNTMIVTTDWNEAYELKLGGVCIGLDTSFMVGIHSRSGMDVCGPFDADIVYNDMGGLRHAQECPIVEVRHLTGDEAAPYVVKRTNRSGS